MALSFLSGHVGQPWVAGIPIRARMPLNIEFTISGGGVEFFLGFVVGVCVILPFKLIGPGGFAWIISSWRRTVIAVFAIIGVWSYILTGALAIMLLVGDPGR